MKKLLLGLALAPFAVLAFDSPSSGPAAQYFFDTNSAEVANVTPATEGDNVTVIGHADQRASEEYNYTLGLQRAQAVAAQMGQVSIVLVSKGKGEAGNCAVGDEDCLQNDRRVDVFVECAIAQFACTSDYPESWMGNVTPEYDPQQVRFVSDRSRF